MATKAERFRYFTERSGPKKPKAPPRPRRDAPVDTAQPGVSATDRKAGVPRKESVRAGKKAAYALELSAGRPSRKSTRKAANRQLISGPMNPTLRNVDLRVGSRSVRAP